MFQWLAFLCSLRFLLLRNHGYRLVEENERL
jgi:hypothetical protein